jgi:hypothetical protein
LLYLAAVTQLGGEGSDRVFIHHQKIAPPETGDAINFKVDKSYLETASALD